MIVHERRAAKEREATGRAHDTAENVLGRFLQPMTNGVLELLIPDHGTRADRMNTSTSGAHFLILLHAIDEQTHRFGSKVNIAVESQQERVLGSNALLVVHVVEQVAKALEAFRFRFVVAIFAVPFLVQLLHDVQIAEDLETEQIVDVHDLRPAFLVTNLHLVF